MLLVESSVLEEKKEPALRHLREDVDQVSRRRVRTVFHMGVPLRLLCCQARLIARACVSLLWVHLLETAEKDSMRRSQHYEFLLGFLYAKNEKYTPDQSAQSRLK